MGEDQDLSRWLEYLAAGRDLDQQQLLNYLAAVVKSEGGLKKCAVGRGVSYQYLGNALNGRQTPGETILKAFGFERVTRYRPAR